ncbi:MAG: ferredoxin family protein [Planctomycetes bacterium]|nr:ferredoxin family protein [Planctomycetota bacterium]
MAKRIAVVVSQGQSNHPAKRALEEDIVTALLIEPGIDVTIIPNLYDLKPDGTGILALQGISGDMIVLSWFFPRAAHWTLDRNDIRGLTGETLLESEDDEDWDEETESDEKDRVIDHRELPKRKIYCLDLRGDHGAAAFIDEIKRIASEANKQVVQLMDWIDGSPKPEQTERFLNPTNDTSSGNGNGQPSSEATRIEETDGRRWYPVIDYSRCTNCMECIDFCLFGVYGVDKIDTILVEQPDNCRKGCPACSRVCPENAIIFPQHKTPAIAGAPGVAESLKIDLSKLFGAPDEGKSAADVAVLERDEQLLIAGRDAVGATVGIAKRQTGKLDEPKDELDDLIDELDDLDL